MPVTLTSCDNQTRQMLLGAGAELTLFAHQTGEERAAASCTQCTARDGRWSAPAWEDVICSLETPSERPHEEQMPQALTERLFHARPYWVLRHHRLQEAVQILSGPMKALLCASRHHLH